MQVGSVASSREAVTATIKTAALDTGADFGFLLRQAQVESGLNPDAKASSSSATGLFQFIDDTWLTMVRRYGPSHGLGEQARKLESGNATPGDRADILKLRKDPQIATRMAAEFASENARALQAAGTPQVGATELYLAHFLGAGGAAKFLNGMRQSPSASAAAALPKAAEANPSIFFPGGKPASFGEVYDRFAKKFEGVGKPTTELMAVASAVVDGAKSLAKGAEPAFKAISSSLRATVSTPVASSPPPTVGVITSEAAAMAVGAKPSGDAAPDTGAPVGAETVAKFLSVMSNSPAGGSDSPKMLDASGRDASEGARI